MLASARLEFFDIFNGSAEIIVESSQMFRTMLGAYPAFGDHATLIKNLEHRADSLTHRTYEILHKTFITPFDREDIQALISRLDDVIDFIDAAAQRVQLYEIGEPTPELIAMADLCVRAGENVRDAIRGLSDLKNPRETMRSCVEINRIENEADVLLRASVAKLFKEEANVKQLIKLKEIYELLETVTDRCEDVANVVDGIILEYG
jgi:uncharacterized protein